MHHAVQRPGFGAHALQPGGDAVELRKVVDRADVTFARQPVERGLQAAFVAAGGDDARAQPRQVDRGRLTDAA